MHALFRFKTVFAILALCLLMAAGGSSRVFAQDDPTASSPIVGVWVVSPVGDESGSIIALSSDGVVVDHETDGSTAIGAWEATGPTSGVMTFVFFFNEPADDFTGSVIIRATLTYDDATDTVAVSYTVTGASPDGTVVFSDEALSAATLTRLAPQGPDDVGQPIEALILVPAATPVS